MSCDGDRFGIKAVVGASSHNVEMCVITLIQRVEGYIISLAECIAQRAQFGDEVSYNPIILPASMRLAGDMPVCMETRFVTHARHGYRVAIDIPPACRFQFSLLFL